MSWLNRTLRNGMSSVRASGPVRYTAGGAGMFSVPRGMTPSSNNVARYAGGGGWFGGFGSMAGGAMVGGMTSYSTGGGFWQGAAVGAAGGGAVSMAARRGTFTRGAGIVHSGAARRLIGNTNARKITQFTRMMENPMHRRVMFGSGAALSGFMFGGNRSHKRGFNRSRGNSIGR